MKSRLLSIVVLSTLIAACSGGSGNGDAPVNAAPTIGAIADLSTMANQTTAPIAFTVSDEQPDSLTLTVMSDNAQVVPESGIAVAGSGRNRSVTVTPTVDMLGDAFVTIIVADAQGLAASSSFLLTIDAEQRSVRQFSRTVFADSADGKPELVNAVEFAQDADEDDFADLLAQ